MATREGSIKKIENFYQNHINNFTVLQDAVLAAGINVGNLLAEKPYPNKAALAIQAWFSFIWGLLPGMAMFLAAPKIAAITTEKPFFDKKLDLILGASKGAYGAFAKTQTASNTNSKGKGNTAAKIKSIVLKNAIQQTYDAVLKSRNKMIKEKNSLTLMLLDNDQIPLARTVVDREFPPIQLINSIGPPQKKFEIEILKFYTKNLPVIVDFGTYSHEFYGVNNTNASISQGFNNKQFDMIRKNYRPEIMTLMDLITKWGAKRSYSKRTQRLSVRVGSII